MFNMLSIKHKFGPMRFHGGRRASAKIIMSSTKLSFVVAAAWDKKLKLTWRELLLHHTWLVVCIIVVKWPLNFSCLAQKSLLAKHLAMSLSFLQEQPFFLGSNEFACLSDWERNLPPSFLRMGTTHLQMLHSQKSEIMPSIENINKSHTLWNTHSNRLHKRKEQHVHLIPGGSFSRGWGGSVINVCILLSKTLQSHCVQIRLELNYSSRHGPTEHRRIQMGRPV